MTVPVRQPLTTAGGRLSVRLIGPRASVWPDSPAANVSVLARTDMIARPLPSNQLPSSPDLVSAASTLRLGDAGEETLTFPNTAGSDGVLWRELFSPAGHLMWFEVMLDGQLEQVVCVDTVAVSDGYGFSSTLDATDFASSMWGNGAGFQSGSVGQLQAVVFDASTLTGSLFDAQGWQDSSDAAFVSLLQALLNAELGLRLTPWQLLSAPAGAGGSAQVAVHGQDAMFLLKKAYERDWVVVQSPRDVVERATGLWVPVTVDDFPAGPVSSQWALSGGTPPAIQPSGGMLLSVPAVNGAVSTATSQALAVNATGTWRASLTVEYANVAQSNYLQLEVGESTSGDNYVLQFYSGYAYLAYSNATVIIGQAQVPTSASYTLLMESDGEWVFGFVNGQLVGCGRRQHPTTTTVQTTLNLANGGGAASTALLTNVLVETLQPFLQRGSDKGDYVLPGGASTYPSGGVHARYYNDLDLQADGVRLSKILSPPRSQAFAGSGASEYASRQDAQLNDVSNPTPGAASSNWSARYFGAIYLKLSAGDYQMQVQTGPGASDVAAIRLWVGKTQFGSQLVDAWSFAGQTTYSFTISASQLAGQLPYGAGSVSRDGWYPIKVEYAVDGAASTGPKLLFAGVPTAYTDPGGTAIAAGAQSTVVPATSLSPLGCVDQRYQGVSHFDLAQQTAQAYGYQMAVEPQRLESGLFPGTLAPRVREGHDTDLVLAPDRTARQDWQGVLKAQLASTWPLPGALAAMLWRPGDGIRVRDAEVGVWDTTPRQILAVNRSLLPGGSASATLSLANRPRNQAHTLKRQFFAATRVQRNYQRQLVALAGNFVSQQIASGTQGPYSVVLTAASDQLVNARLRVTYNTGQPFHVYMNGVEDVTSTLGGPWGATVPVNISLGAVLAPDANGQVFFALYNSGTAAATFSYQLFVDVLR